MTDYRWVLRERTAAAHQRVDAAIGDFADRAGYASYLSAIARFRLPIEEQLRRIERPGALADMPVTVLAKEIALDLADLDLQLPDAKPSDLEMQGDGLLGVLYVLEGSALGARVLLKRAEALGLSAEFGARHLALAAKGTGWRTLLDLMGRIVPFDLDSATRASLATFAAAHTAFSRTA